MAYLSKVVEVNVNKPVVWRVEVGLKCEHTAFVGDVLNT